MMPKIAFYCAVSLVVLCSLVFGLDWQAAPLPPVAADKTAVQAALDYVRAQTEAQAKIEAEAAARALAETKAREAKAAKAAPPIAASNAARPAQVPIIVPLPPPPDVPVIAAAAPPVPEAAKQAPLCDVAACAAAYRSFKESDCTFNPSVGPRRLCTKGVAPKEAQSGDAPPPSIVKAEPGTPLASQAAANARCNVSVCAAAYVSFTESDCTYQPSDGPRRLCTK
jgi:hypothetical protein